MIAAQGAIGMPGPVAEFRAFLLEEIDCHAAVARDAGVEPA